MDIRLNKEIYNKNKCIWEHLRVTSKVEKSREIHLDGLNMTNTGKWRPQWGKVSLSMLMNFSQNG